LNIGRKNLGKFRKIKRLYLSGDRIKNIKNPNLKLKIRLGFFVVNFKTH